MGSVLACCAADMACCATRSALKCVCCTLPWGKSSATRLMYAAMFVLMSVFTVIASNKASTIIAAKYVTAECDEACINFFATYKFGLAMVLYHALWTVLLFGARGESDDWRTTVQNGFWPLKAAILVATTVGVMFIPNEKLLTYWIASVIFSAIFVVIQSVLLVDFAHSWAESWIEAYEEGRNGYKWLLIIASVLLLAAYLTALVFCFINFQDDLFKFFISANLILAVLYTILSVAPGVQEANPRSGLLPPLILAIYTLYLVATGMMGSKGMESIVADDGFVSAFTKYLGILFAFLSLGYGAFRMGSSGAKLGLSGKADEESPTSSVNDDGDSEYSFSFFHFAFLLASFYLPLVLTNWHQPIMDEITGVITLTNSGGAMWVKVAASWFIALLFKWTLIAPIVLKDREFG